MKPLLAVAATLAAAVSCPAQVAYPEDSPTTSQGNLVPLGFSTSTNFDEGRYQILIPARFLPSTGGLINGLSVTQASGPPQLTYTSLTITMSATQATTLSTTFANNLPVPLVVFGGSNVTIPFATSGWSPPIQFTQPFPYDGQSDLVIDISKVYDRVTYPSTSALSTHRVSGNPGRSDLPVARYQYGAFGSGAATAPTARTSAAPLKVRLDFAPLPTLRLRSDRAGANNYIFAISGSMDITIAGPAGTQFGTLVALGFLPTPFPAAPLLGSVWIDLSTAVTVNVGAIGPTGETATTLAIPNLPGIVGGRLTFQSVTVGAGTGVLALSNACDAIINS
ncbi:MAG: hypothetical protein IPM29_23075 [Planctomycetes bacterium]|nr:hypothetical protein [Planctomycetota bacterium]